MPGNGDRHTGTRPVLASLSRILDIQHRESPKTPATGTQKERVDAILQFTLYLSFFNHHPKRLWWI